MDIDIPSSGATLVNASLPLPQDNQAPPTPLIGFQPNHSSKEYKLADIKGYVVGEEIGGGGFSVVYRAYNPQAELHRVVACKLVSISSPSSTSSSSASASDPSSSSGADLKELQKEVQVHRILKHKYVLEFLDSELIKSGKRVKEWREGVGELELEVRGGLYMLLEYAMGGDLFDKIAPDYGVDEDTARFYFAQLISGLEYIHEKGICHRDLKPENLLLSAEGDLKISDFGLCAVWKHKGQVRKLSGRCGSLPYVAPELNQPGSYSAEPVDVWGAGVVLFTLLAGNTPWDEPSLASPEFAAYLTGELLHHDPWNKILGYARDLLLGLLEVDVEKRLTLEGVKEHAWFLTQSQIQRRTLAERLTQGLRDSGMSQIADAVPQSQASRLKNQFLGAPPGQGIQSQFSQYTQMPTQFMQATGMTSTMNGTTVVTPLTRFRVNLTYLETQQKLETLLLKSLRPEQLIPLEEGSIMIRTLDKRKQILQGVLIVSEDGDHPGTTMVHLRKTMGDPMEWRRFWWKLVKSGDLKDSLVT